MIGVRTRATEGRAAPSVQRAERGRSPLDAAVRDRMVTRTTSTTSGCRHNSTRARSLDSVELSQDALLEGSVGSARAGHVPGIGARTSILRAKPGRHVRDTVTHELRRTSDETEAGSRRARQVGTQPIDTTVLRTPRQATTCARARVEGGVRTGGRPTVDRPPAHRRARRQPTCRSRPASTASPTPRPPIPLHEA